MGNVQESSGMLLDYRRLVLVQFVSKGIHFIVFYILRTHM